MADYDITDPGGSATIGGVIFEDAANIGSGTGNYDTFLALNDNDGTIAGFNSDDRGSIDPTNSNMDAAKSEAILLGSLSTVWIDGVEYYEIRLDLNENNSGSEDTAKSQISLEAFKIYTSGDGTIEDLPTLETQNLAYDMDAGGDNTVFLSEESTGSGTDDYAFYIPVSHFEGLDPATTYFYLYTEMGREEPWEENAGFEEFNQQKAGLINGIKFEDANSNGTKEEGEQGLEGIVIYVDEDGDGQLDTWDTNRNGVLDDGETFDAANNEKFDVTDANGYYALTGIPVSGETVIIREELTGDNADYIATNPDGVDAGGAYWTAMIGATGEIVTKNIGNFIPNPQIAIDKQVIDVGGDGPDGVVDEAGDVITYHLVVTNTGNVDLTNVTVTDPLTGTDYLIGNLAKGASVTVGDGDDVDVVYTATQGDMDDDGDGDGDIDNTATVTGEYGDDTVSDHDSEEVPLEQQNGINLIKSSDTVTINGPTTVTYDFTLTNTGNYAQEITSVVDQGFIPGDASDDFLLYDGSDSIIASGDTDGDRLLDVGETWTFSRDVEITQEQFDSNLGGLTNIACAYTPDTFHCDGHDIDRYNLAIQKSVYSVDGSLADLVVDAAGEQVVYHIDVTNTGDLELTGLEVIDTIADSVTYLEEVAGNGDGSFDAGEIWRYEAIYTATQDDLDTNGGGDGDIDNEATAEANEAGPVSDTEEVPVEQLGGIKLVKTSGVSYISGPGDVIYSYTLTNTGNYAQAIASVVDDNFTPGDASDDITLYDGTGPVSGDTDGDNLLDVGEEWTFQTTVAISQEEFDTNEGGLTNVACAVTADGLEACDEYDLNRAILTIDKSVKDINGDPSKTTATAADDVITYTITVTNAGEEMLTNVIVTDPLTGLNQNLGTLMAGESASTTASYTVTQADLDGQGIDYLGEIDGDGDVDNIATGDSDQTDKVTDDEVVPLLYDPKIDITKLATMYNADGTLDEDQIAETAGDYIAYTIEVFNIGNVTLTDVVVEDDILGYITTIDEIGVGQSVVLNPLATVEITQEMLDAQNPDMDGHADECDFENVATATAQEIADSVIAAACSNFAYDPKIDIEKLISVNGGAFQDADNPKGPEVDIVGDTVTFRLEVTNTGNITLTNVTIEDLKYIEGVFDSEVTVPTLIGLTDEDGDGEMDDLAVGGFAYVEYTDTLTADQHRNDATVTTTQGATDTDSAHYFGLINEGPGVRTPGGWGNSWKLKLYWDGEEGNEPHVSDSDNFPDAELMTQSEVADNIFIIGDHMNGGNGVLDAGEYAINYDMARMLLENGGGRKGDKALDLMRHAIATELNFRAGNGYQDTTPDEPLDSPEEWLQEAIDWFEFNADGPMKGKNSVWNNEANGISAGGEILSALDEYNNHGTIDGERFAHDADSVAFQAAIIEADGLLFG